VGGGLEVGSRGNGGYGQRVWIFGIGWDGEDAGLRCGLTPMTKRPDLVAGVALLGFCLPMT
jgi:hypothetical protein